MDDASVKSSVREISLGDDFYAAVVQGRGAEVELTVDGSVIIYTNGCVKVNSAPANDAAPKADTAPRKDAVAKEKGSAADRRQDARRHNLCRHLSGHVEADVYNANHGFP